MTLLRVHAANGVRWTGLSLFITTILQFLQLGLLGRLLEPQDFGYLALVMFVVGFAQIFGQMGLSEALIQRQEATKNEISSLYWLNVIFGFFIFLIICIFAPIIATVFGISTLKKLLPIIATSFIIAAFGNQFQALMQKSLHFQKLAYIEILYFSTNVIISVLLAWYGMGLWSLIWGHLIGTLVRTSGLILYAYKESILPHLHFSLQETRSYLNFGLYRVGAMSINYLNSRIDQLFIGALLGPQALGYYSMSANLVLQPVQKLNPVLTRVAFPIFSKIYHDHKLLKNAYIKMVQLLMFVNSPVLIGLAVSAPVVIPLFLGKQWNDIVPMVQVLAIYALIRSLGNAGGTLIVACGLANKSFYWNIILLLSIPPVVYLASKTQEVINVCWALTLIQLCLFFIHYFIFIKPIIGPCFKSYFQASFFPIILSLLIALLVIIVNSFIEEISLLWQLFIGFTTGITTYCLLIFFLKKEYIIDVVNLVFLKK